MLKADLPELKVLEYTQALQRTQNLESRGDLQNKGIYKLLVTIYEWSEKFLSNKSLPTLDYLERELGIEEEKIVHFVLEYAVRSNPPLFRKLNYVDFDTNSSSGDSSQPSSHLKHFTVLCRPTAADGVSCYRYATGLNDISFDAIKRWITERRVLRPKEERKTALFQSIDDNRLVDSYASSEIGSLYQCQFDKTKKLKDVTLIIHIKPVLKRLVDERIIFFIRNERASKPGNKSVFYYFNKEEIFDRLDIYMDYLREKIVPDLVRIGVLNEPEEEDYLERKTLVETIHTYLNDSYGDQKTVVEEILLLNDFYTQEMERVEAEKKRQNLDALMEYVRTSGKILNLHTLKMEEEPLTDEGKSFLLSNNNILYTEYADKSGYYEYILHRSNVGQAVEEAILHYKKTKSDSELTILRYMGAIEEVEDFNLVKDFEDAESSSLFSFLPFFTWLWRWITGNRSVHKFEAEEIRKNIRQGIQNKISQKRPLFLSQERERKNREGEDKSNKDAQRRKKKLTGFQSGTVLPMGDARKQVMNELSMDGVDSDPQTEKDISQIKKILNEAWDFGLYPDRNYLKEKMDSSMSEDDLIQFIKKKGGKEIYSFMIRNQMEKYPFPILISRDYLKKNGSKLTQEAEKVLEVQKSSAMPEQTKFDTAVSLLEFLDRILPKLK